MENENNQPVEEKNQLEERQKKLVADKKVAEEKAASETEGRIKAEKERDFYASFSDSVAKNPVAAEYRDKIKEKVMSGYTTEDATISILHAEGKLGQVVSPQAQPKENVIGGSAVNQVAQVGSKTVKEMTSAERWETLREAERRGDIGWQ